MKNHKDDSFGYVANVCVKWIELFLTKSMGGRRRGNKLLVKMAGVCLSSE